MASFEENALARLRRYRRAADETVRLVGEVERAARRFAGRLFGGLEYTATLARRAGFDGLRTERVGDALRVEVAVRPGMESSALFGLVPGAAAETEETLMHEELSGWPEHPGGYSARVLGWSSAAGERPCQIFAVYRDGVWKTDGLFVIRSRGHLGDPDEVMRGFCLRILGRIIDLAALTEGAGRRWTDGEFPPEDYLRGTKPPTDLRWPR
ncbi:hypothetical protein E0L93_11610 [Rubrobacter taiwanensis]|jgi:hypothetical protein|uniref:Uncharacterized protein n=1 Tax=Rubrobacter taiwanensis TaxID=185139 RepID=A0A4R1BFK3_9ACTN|nr:hypothetical protein [Rubrobacter taiwanensis]TCJ15897.1 hypothetical protein E0L93_11610 [Rubrobacter taiwanensis]